ncbi:hypothetical protein Anapl_06244 [Anas platyrhynchos]|uniref:Uncharacterized protein n=1 Tax=Anas platyrhynchos TaxID=8839 RepID=R0LL94_ANAPL|nr:hypothetical protein Anapl_06244 [Anas platyrhynchos]
MDVVTQGPVCTTDTAVPQACMEQPQYGYFSHCRFNQVLLFYPGSQRSPVLVKDDEIANPTKSNKADGNRRFLKVCYWCKQGGFNQDKNITEAQVKEKSGELGDASGKGWFLQENQHILVAECTDTAADTETRSSSPELQHSEPPRLCPSAMGTAGKSAPRCSRDHAADNVLWDDEPSIWLTYTDSAEDISPKPFWALCHVLFPRCAECYQEPELRDDSLQQRRRYMRCHGIPGTDPAIAAIWNRAHPASCSGSPCSRPHPAPNTSERSSLTPRPLIIAVLVRMTTIRKCLFRLYMSCKAATAVLFLKPCLEAVYTIRPQLSSAASWRLPAAAGARVEEQGDIFPEAKPWLGRESPRRNSTLLQTRGGQHQPEPCASISQPAAFLRGHSIPRPSPPPRETSTLSSSSWRGWELLGKAFAALPLALRVPPGLRAVISMHYIGCCPKPNEVYPLPVPTPLHYYSGKIQTRDCSVQRFAPGVMWGLAQGVSTAPRAIEVTTATFFLQTAAHAFGASINGGTTEFLQLIEECPGVPLKPYKRACRQDCQSLMTKDGPCKAQRGQKVVRGIQMASCAGQLYTVKAHLNRNIFENRRPQEAKRAVL